MSIDTKREGPIFITGTFRSGTTLLAQIFKNNSNIELLYDTVNFMRFSYQRYNPITDINNVRELLQEIAQRINSRWGLSLNYEKIILQLRHKSLSYAVIYDTIMNDLLLDHSTATIWGEKTVLAWTKIPDFFSMFPNARVIHIIRDPRAVINSWKKMTSASENDYLDGVFNCIDSMEKAIHYSELFKDQRYVVVKYEELVKRPFELVNKLCKDLHIQFEENMLDFKHYTNKKGSRWKGNSMFNKEMQHISIDTIDLWKVKLEDWEIRFIEFFAGDLMNKWDYELLTQELSNSEFNNFIEEIQKSKLLTNGVLKYFFHKKGCERFPSDPLNCKNWDKENRW